MNFIKISIIVTKRLKDFPIDIINEILRKAFSDELEEQKMKDKLYNYCMDVKKYPHGICQVCFDETDSFNHCGKCVRKICLKCSDRCKACNLAVCLDCEFCRYCENKKKCEKCKNYAYFVECKYCDQIVCNMCHDCSNTMNPYPDDAYYNNNKDFYLTQEEKDSLINGPWLHHQLKRLLLPLDFQLIRKRI